MGGAEEDGAVEKSVEKSGRQAGSRAGKGAVSGAGKHAVKYALVGVFVTLFDFVVCTVLTRVVFRTNDALEFSAAVATVLATILAYFLHSRITWKDRKPAKFGVAKFFLWNGLVAVVIKPLVAWGFGNLYWLYKFVLQVTEAIGLPFGYDTIEYLGIYGLSTLVIMILNFFFYDKLVFGRKKKR